MNPEMCEQFADRWLDAALKEYSAVEPLPGLESRILELPSRDSRPRWFTPSFVWTAAAALVLVALSLGALGTWRSYKSNHGSPASQPNLPTAIARLGTLSRTPTLPAKARSIPSRRHRGTPSETARSESPRRDHFPSPAPLSEDERLMIAYVRNTPREEVLLVVARQPVEDEKAQKTLNLDSAPDLGFEGALH